LHFVIVHSIECVSAAPHSSRAESEPVVLQSGSLVFGTLDAVRSLVEAAVVTDTVASDCPSPDCKIKIAAPATVAPGCFVAAQSFVQNAVEE